MSVYISKFPACTLIDMDCECSPYYDGKTAGTTSVSGYSEEYRLQQLGLNPMLQINLESNAILPDPPMKKIVERYKILRMTMQEDNQALADLLGLSQ
jgi:hypothetical protein